MRTPPASTPTAAPEPPIAPQIPSALLRSAPSSNVVVTIESAAGVMTRRAEALDGARDDQHALRPREAAEERGDREDDDADQEDAARPSRSAARPPSSRKPPNVIA